jgi:AhpD family alkylhydroperoxidase
MEPQTYPDLRDRLRFYLRKLAQESPGGAMGAFGRLHREALAEGALSTRVKELMCIAIGIASRCDGCLAFHIHGALRAGATRDEILETIAVALMMGGGPSSIYGARALEALEQFEVAAADAKEAEAVAAAT